MDIVESAAPFRQPSLIMGQSIRVNQPIRRSDSERVPPAE